MASIPVYHKGMIVAYTQVDDADYVWLNQWVWHRYPGNDNYVRRREAGKNIRLHRVILGLAPSDPRMGDHIDRDKLNNRRSNLRIATQAQNNQNVGPRSNTSSSYRGVFFFKPTGKWAASCRINKKQYHVGYFDTEIEAAKAASDWRKAHMPYTKEP